MTGELQGVLYNENRCLSSLFDKNPLGQPMSKGIFYFPFLIFFVKRMIASMKIAAV